MNTNERIEKTNLGGRNMKKGLYVVLGAVTGSLAATIMMLAVQAMADGNQSTDSVPRYIAYHGTLEKDGEGVNATVQMKFELFDGATTLASAWNEIQGVTVYAGRFSVMLGSTSAASVSALEGKVKGADDLYLAVSIKSGNDWITLSGKQRFLPTPYAVWSTASTNLTTGSINGLANASLLLNNTTGGTVDLGGKLDIYGPDINFKNHPDRGNGGRAIVHGVGDKLQLNFGGDFAGGTTIEGSDVEPATGGGYSSVLALTNAGSTMYLDGNEIESSSTLYLNSEGSGGVSVGGHLTGTHFNCRDTACGAVVLTPPGGGGWGGWKGWSKCPENTYVCGMEQKVEDPTGGDDTAMNAVQFLCCPF